MWTVILYEQEVACVYSSTSATCFLAAKDLIEYHSALLR